MSSPLRRWGADVREQLGDGPNAARRAAQRDAFVRHATSAERRRARHPLIAWSTAGATAALAAAATMWWIASAGDPTATLTATTEGGEQVTDGTWLQTEGTGALQVLFSEGSRIELAGQTRTRFATIAQQAVALHLESGTLRARVRHADRRVWRFHAGPYRVRVEGTRLSIGWAPSHERLEVHVTEGRVRVRGPNTGDGGVAVQRGHELTAEPEGLQMTRPETQAPSSRSIDASALRPDGGSGRPRPETEEPVRAPSKRLRGRSGRPGRTDRNAGSRAAAEPAPDSGPSWKQLAERGAYRRAMAAAKRDGFDTLVTRLGPKELLLLGDAARLAGDTERAIRAFSAVRRRFGDSRQAAAAAFRRGRLAFDQQQDYRAAARWFATFVQQRPDSSLAADARGRRMEALHRAGDRQGARRAARRYLAHHPEGRYAARAKVLLRKP